MSGRSFITIDDRVTGGLHGDRLERMVLLEATIMVPVRRNSLRNRQSA